MWGLCKGKSPHHRAPGSGDVGRPRPVCGEQQCCMEYKDHFSPRALGMLKELSAWGKTPQCMPYGLAGACPGPFRGSSAAEHTIRSHCHCHFSAELGLSSLKQCLSRAELASGTCGAVDFLGLRKAALYLGKTRQHRALLSVSAPVTVPGLLSPKEVLGSKGQGSPVCGLL